MRVISLMLFICCLSPDLRAQQEETVFVWEAVTSLNYPLDKGWSMNTSLATRTTWLNVTTPANENFEGRLSFAEFNQFATYKVNPFVKLSFGYKYRQIDPAEQSNRHEHRLTQQIAFLHQSEVVRTATRIRSEQRFINGIFSQRFRYRLSMDFPLAGQSLDAKEFYLVASEELLYEFSRQRDNIFGNRISLGLGYLFSQSAKLQVTAMYRTDVSNFQAINRLFIETALFVNL
ncbi:MAG: DUF2490 domain-containing protein [Bacteroidota bacterium]